MANPDVARNTPRRARVGGSGFTIFQWENKVIAFAREVSHTSPTPVGPGATPIHPMDEPYPIEIITPAAANIGSIDLELYELYGTKVWEHLSGLANSIDIVDVFIAVKEHGTPITMTKTITPPKLGTLELPSGTSPANIAVAPYSESYHNCVITNVQDGERINVGTMEVMKIITVAYTHKTGGPSGNNVRPRALDLRNQR